MLNLLSSSSKIDDLSVAFRQLQLVYQHSYITTRMVEETYNSSKHSPLTKKRPVVVLIPIHPFLIDSVMIQSGLGWSRYCLD
jgi:hypothetical protein